MRGVRCVRGRVCVAPRFLAWGPRVSGGVASEAGMVGTGAELNGVRGARAGAEQRAVFGRQITRAVSWKFLPSWKCFPAVLSEKAAPYIVLVWLRTEFFILLNFNKFNWPQGLVATLFWGGMG